MYLLYSLLRMIKKMRAKSDNATKIHITDVHSNKYVKCHVE